MLHLIQKITALKIVFEPVHEVKKLVTKESQVAHMLQGRLIQKETGNNASVSKCEVLMWKERHNFQLADPKLIQKTPNKGHTRTSQEGCQNQSISTSLQN